MTIRTVLIVVLALVFGGAAAVYAQYAINRNHEVRDPDKIEVVIATTTVNPGKALHEGMLTVKKVAKGEEPEDAIHDIAELTQKGGRVTAVKLVKGVTIQRSMLADEGAREGMANMIRGSTNDKDEKVWMQAATIVTPTPSAGVGGFILPGDYVDVLLTVDRLGKDDHGATIRLMQRVEVLAADNRTEANQGTVEGKIVDHRELRYVTLLVSPTEGQKLALAQKQGTLTLILRNPKDDSFASDTLVTAADLKLVSPPEEKKQEVVSPPPKKPEPPPPIRGFFGVREYPIFLP